jgi:hypothetical protein
MTKDRKMTVIVDSGTELRGDSFTKDEIPIGKLASEVQAFIKDIGEILDLAARSISGSARLAEVEVSASIEMGGKISLLGTGVETKGQAGINFKFAMSPAAET